MLCNNAFKLQLLRYQLHELRTNLAAFRQLRERPTTLVEDHSTFRAGQLWRVALPNSSKNVK